MSRCLGRFEGRLFVEDGCLFMVVAADEATEKARVSCRIDGQTQVIEMPLADVARRVAASAGVILDNLNAPESARRIHEGDDGWYVSSREGRMGPFATHKEAGHELVKHILCMQAANDTPREPLRSRSRRSDTDEAGRPAAAQRRAG